MIDVAVIGGGISGLSCAYFLVRRGFDVAILERQVRPGGKAISEHIDGFLMEHGPSSVSPLPDDVTLLSGEVGLDSDRLGLGAEVRNRYLTKSGMLARISCGHMGLLTAPYLSLGGRGRLLAEIAVPRPREHRVESVADFFNRRFGREFADKVIDPLVGGLFAARATELDMAAAFPRLIEMERRSGSLTRAVVVRMIAGARVPGGRLFSWRDGISALPRALARRLGDSIASGVAVQRIVKERHGLDVDAGRAGRFRARSVVVATQPHVAASLAEPLTREAAEELHAIPAPPISVVFLGYRRDQVAHPLDGVGYLTASEERRQVSGALFCSTMFAGRAPEGHVALSLYIGGSRAPDAASLPAADLAALARADVGELLGARGEPVVTRIRHWPRGLPQMTLGHRSRLTVLAQAVRRVPGLFLTGNYIDGVGVAGCVACARRTADDVAEFLSRERRFQDPPHRVIAV